MDEWATGKTIGVQTIRKILQRVRALAGWALFGKWTDRSARRMCKTEVQEQKAHLMKQAYRPDLLWDEEGGVLLSFHGC